MISLSVLKTLSQRVAYDKEQKDRVSSISNLEHSQQARSQRGKSRGLQWKKWLSEVANHDVYSFYCSKFVNVTNNHSKSSRSFVRLSSNMFFCRKNLIKNEEIMNEFRKPSYEAANRLVTRATQVGHVDNCVGNSNLDSEIIQHDAE